MSRPRQWIPLDDALEFLVSPHRRHILRYLLEEADPPSNRYGLARHLSEREGWEVELLESQLSHNQLPRLAGAGVIEYNTTAGHCGLPGPPRTSDPCWRAARRGGLPGINRARATVRPQLPDCR